MPTLKHLFWKEPTETELQKCVFEYDRPFAFLYKSRVMDDSWTLSAKKNLDPNYYKFIKKVEPCKLY